MKKKETSLNISFPGFYEILHKLERIEKLLEHSSQNNIGGYIPEKEACKILGKKTTWFWNLRKNGELPYTKVGNTVYYDKKDLKSLLDNAKQDS